MVINGSFDGYIRQIPFQDTPGRPKDQTLFYDQWPKTLYFGPQNGPKRPKLAFCCYIRYIIMQGVIFTYFSALSSSVLFSYVDFYKYDLFWPYNWPKMINWGQKCHSGATVALRGYNPA